MIEKYAIENVSKIDAKFSTVVEDPGSRKAIIDYIFGNLGVLGSGVAKSASEDAARSLSEFVKNISYEAKRAHISAILEATSGTEREKRYLNLRYRVKSDFDGKLICPDTMVLFLTSDKVKPFLDADDRLEAVWIPLTSDLLLIGELTPSADRNNQSVLRALASTSYTAFVGKTDDEILRKLSPRIGKNATIQSSKDLNMIKRKVLASLV
jgi:hypothetical protein